MEIVPYNKNWPKIFQAEKELVSSTLGDNVIDIQHIGSTSIPQMSAKPIIDIAVLLPTLENATKYIPLLKKIGYQFFKERSSVERFFFVKGEPAKYHLSLAQPEKFSYWKRQILFRDYLKSHSDLAKEYEKLKKQLIQQHSDGRQKYSEAKSEFINKIISLSEQKQN